jgi:hypothetical protein
MKEIGLGVVKWMNLFRGQAGSYILYHDRGFEWPTCKPTIKRSRFFILYTSILKMEAACFSRMLVCSCMSTSWLTNYIDLGPYKESSATQEILSILRYLQVLNRIYTSPSLVSVLIYMILVHIFPRVLRTHFNMILPSMSKTSLYLFRVFLLMVFLPCVLHCQPMSTSLIWPS